MCSARLRSAKFKCRPRCCGDRLWIHLKLLSSSTVGSTHFRNSQFKVNFHWHWRPGVLTHTPHTHTHHKPQTSHAYAHLYVFVGLTVIKNKRELGQKLRQCQSHFQFMSIKNGRRLLEWETRWGVFYRAAFEESCLFGDAHLGPTISIYYETVGLIVVSQQMGCSWRSVQGTISLCSLAWFLEFSVPGLPHPVHPSLL